MINILLQKNDGFKWYNKNGIYVKGYFFDEKGVFYHNESLLSYFDTIKDTKDLTSKIQNANGLFSIVMLNNELVLLVVDRIRMFPLFYGFLNEQLTITDKPGIFPKDINKEACEEFLATGFVTGKNTLLNNVFQLQAGELKIYDKEWKKHIYYHYLSNEKSNIKYEESVKKAHEVFNITANNLIKSLNNKTAVIPLSGGLDSRWIAAALKLNNYEKVICFSYGRKGNKESEISQKIAKTLGFEWHFVLPKTIKKRR